MSRRFWGYLVLVLLGAVVLFFGAPRIYHRIKAERLASVAADAFREGDEAKAMAFAQRTLEIHPGHGEAIRIVAFLLLEQRHPQALMWFARWVENDPKDAKRLLSLGNAALLMNDLTTAQSALSILKKLPGSPPEVVLSLETAVLVREGRLAKAIDLLDTTARISGTSFPPALRLNHASLLLASEKDSDRLRGLEILESLATVPEVRVAALRTRVQFGLSRKMEALMFPGVEQLVKEPAAPARDVLLWGSALLQTDRPLPGDFYTLLEAAVGTDAAAFSRAVDWIMANAQWQGGIHWMRTLLEKSPADPFYGRSLAALLAASGDWSGLRDWLSQSAWPESDPRRLIYELQAHRQTEGALSAMYEESMLDKLESSLRKNPLALSTCDQIISAWGWHGERIRLWDAVADSRPSLPAAWLWGEIRRAQSNRDTVRLYGLTRLLLIHQREDPVLLNNGATYGLLLGHKVDYYATVAEKNLAKKPEDKGLLTTLALARIRENRAGDALALFKKFTPEELREPAFAAYYAMALRASGEAVAASPYAERARDLPLLPEERLLAGMDPRESSPGAAKNQALKPR